MGNLKWKEMECDFNKLQKEKIDLQATMDGLIKNNASLKKQFDENRALQEKYHKLNESKMKFEDLNKRIFELEDDLKATNIRNAVIYKQYIAENEQNLKWKEMECDFNKLQKEKIDLQATMDGLIKNNASLK